MKYPVGRHHIQYGNTIIEYDLIFSSRETLAVNVHPDMTVTVEAPVGSEYEQIEKRVKKRASWIARQWRHFEKRPTPVLPRQYVSGETHYYLGRRYRLKVIASTVERVKLDRGRLFIHVCDTANYETKKRLIDAWYRRRATFVFDERLKATFPRVKHLDIPYPNLAIRVMKSRWGSCSLSGRLTLNLKLILVSKDCIDYVIIHELCHLKEPAHNLAFYGLLDHVLPNWRQTRLKLNRFEIR